MHRPESLLLQWHITERCNLRCSHCYQSSFSGEEMDYGGLLAVLKQFKELLISLKGKDSIGPKGHVTVTGGEPFIRPDFFDLLRVFSANRGLFSFAILTNGGSIDRAAASELKKLKPSFVQISMEGGPETHDRIRGPASFEKTLSAVRCLVREGVRTYISFTAHKGNYHEFPTVADIARSLRVSRVWADRYIPPASGPSRPSDPQAPCALDPLETFNFFKLMNRARESGKMSGWLRPRRTEVAMHRGLQFLVGGGRPYKCAAGESLISILPNGDVYPCRRMPVRVGNVLETSLAKIYHESEMLNALRDPDRIGDRCRRCFFARECRGGLRCLSYAINGGPFEGDPGCWLRIH